MSSLSSAFFIHWKLFVESLTHERAHTIDTVCGSYYHESLFHLAFNPLLSYRTFHPRELKTAFEIRLCSNDMNSWKLKPQNLAYSIANCGNSIELKYYIVNLWGKIISIWLTEYCSELQSSNFVELLSVVNKRKVFMCTSNLWDQLSNVCYVSWEAQFFRLNIWMEFVVILSFNYKAIESIKCCINYWQYFFKVDNVTRYRWVRVRNKESSRVTTSHMLSFPGRILWHIIVKWHIGTGKNSWKSLLPHDNRLLLRVVKNSRKNMWEARFCHLFPPELIHLNKWKSSKWVFSRQFIFAKFLSCWEASLLDDRVRKIHFHVKFVLSSVVEFNVLQGKCFWSRSIEKLL